MSAADTKPKAGTSEIDQRSIDTIRTLTIDAVQKANSGHAGAPMGLAPVAFTLWNHYLRYDPANPHWPNRDRFVLSVGHASMLLYSLLHLAEVAEKDGANAPAVSLEDLKKFRQLDSRTPGHPEYHFTTGVEVTTGPLGQGVANSVGMAMGGRFLGERLAYGDRPLFDYNVYAMCSDGDLMEGVSAEAASIAGHLRLSNLCWIYDNNTITIEGHTDLAFSEEVAARFLAYGWQVLRVADANDTVAVSHAIETFLQSGDRPTLIIVNSVIGYGAPTKQGTPKAHSDALGPDEVKGAKRAYGWPEDAQFLVPDGVYDNFRQGIGARGKALREEWLALVEEVKAGDAGLAKDLATYLAGGLPEDWDADIPVFPADAKGWPPANRRARCSTPSPTGCRGCSAARPTSRPRTRPSSRARRPAPSGRSRPAAATSISACASTRWARSSTASGWWACAPTGRPSWSSPTTCARRSGSPP